MKAGRSSVGSTLPLRWRSIMQMHLNLPLKPHRTSFLTKQPILKAGNQTSFFKKQPILKAGNQTSFLKKKPILKAGNQTSFFK